MQRSYIDTVKIGAIIAALSVLGCAGSGRSVQRIGFPWPALGAAGPEVAHAEVSTLNASFHRIQSRVLVRSVKRPTRANLDYAAYHANPMLYVPADGQTVPAARRHDEGAVFDGVIAPGSLVGSLAETPLRDDELARPLAFSPLVDYLSRWNPQLASGLEDARTSVRAESWGSPPSMQVMFQEITEVFWHVAGPRDPEPGLQWWVEIEFQPWATLFDAMPDSDGDGFPELYGRLRGGLVSPEAIERLRADYLGQELDGKLVRTWLNELASYWYPSYNTDIAIAGRETRFPAEDTEQGIVAELAGATVEGVLFALRGKPQGEVIYNVFAVEGVSAVDFGKMPTVELGKRGPASITAKATQLAELLRTEVKEQGGGAYDKWAEKLRPVHERIRKLLAKRPAKVKGFVGKDGWLFFRGSLSYVTSGDLKAQPPGKNPFETIVAFKNALATLGVDFLLVPVPTKAEVYPDKLLDVPLQPGGEPPLLSPYGRKLMLELAEAGVESVDLLPVFLAQRSASGPGDEPLYLTQDTHWSRKGLGLAARAVARRVGEYPWFAELGAPQTMTRRQVELQEPGDLVSRLTPSEARKVRPMSLVADQVLDAAGKVYDDDPASPIVVLGDSFTGVFQRTFTSGAGVSAQLAAELGHPVDLVMSYGGGPNVRRALLRRGIDDLAKRRLVIWMFAARDLYDYYEDWEVISFE